MQEEKVIKNSFMYEPAQVPVLKSEMKRKKLLDVIWSEM